MERINVLFLMRIDSCENHGGDVVQAKKYQQVLEKRINGLKVYFNYEIENEEIKRIYWDFVICFNVIRIQEYGYWLNKLDYGKAVLVPIISPRFRFSFKNTLKSIFRFLFHKKEITKILLSPRKCLKMFDGIIFLSEKEKSAFFSGYRNELKPDIVDFICENGIDESSGIFNDNVDRDIDFLVVGRIEQMKNPLFSLDFVTKFFPERKIVFIGNENPYHRKYVTKFKEEIERTNSLYLGRLSRDDVFKYYRRSKILLNLSLTEVSPLVDLEALSMGCKVISTVHSYSHLHDSDNVLIVNPLEIGDKIEDVRLMLDSDFNITDVQFGTWEKNLESFISFLK